MSRHDVPSFMDTFQELVGYEITYEIETENPSFDNYPTISYLDYNIIRAPSGYLISLYRKKQQSMRILHYTSHISFQVKRSTLLYHLRRIIYRTSIEYLERDLYNCITQILINAYPYAMIQDVLHHISISYMQQSSRYIQKPTYARYQLKTKYIRTSSYPGLQDKRPRPRRYRRSLVFSCDEISKILMQTTNIFHKEIQPFSRSETLYTMLNMSLRSISSSTTTITPRHHILMVSCQICGIGIFCTGKGNPTEIIEDICRDPQSPISIHMGLYQHNGITRYVKLPINTDMQIQDQLYIYQQIYRSMGIEWNSSQKYNIIPRFIVLGLKAYLEKVPTKLPIERQNRRKLITLNRLSTPKLVT
ncbi:uncharacterized protein LOC119688242 [Teleopsis dalmanni]|uniref:uncharacterized protein LOC119688242 n=1 Tax=Teleopsis dalmanni TaxID=139649 RepID=UPI0018CFD58D|nr:uncharacterized protein LOC119688242 [Teleopsis dalmanni]